MIESSNRAAAFRWSLAAAAGAALSACLVDLHDVSGRVCDDANPCAGDQVCRSGQCEPRPQWLSGVAATVHLSASVFDGSFEKWRGRPVEIGGTWCDGNRDEQAACPSVVSSPAGEWSNWKGPLEVAIGAIYKTPRSGTVQEAPETWKDAKDGNYDERWVGLLKKLSASRKGRGTTYLRFAAQFNGDWMGDLWKVSSAEIPDFLATWRHFHQLKTQYFPEAKLVWSVNDGSAPDIGDPRDAYPGSEYVDVISVVTMNFWPFADNAEKVAARLIRTEAGVPVGIEKWREFAESMGVPLALSGWGTPGADKGGGGGGESPAYMVGMYEWLKQHGGSGRGQVLYEILFNQPPDYSLFPGTETKQPLTAAKYAELW